MNNIDELQVIEEQELIVEPEVEVESEVEPVVEPEVEPVVEPEVEAEPDTVGVVSDCTHLNIRKGANKSASIISVIPAGTEVKIDLKKSNRDWYKVCTAFGIEGFCMKEYITIKQ